MAAGSASTLHRYKIYTRRGGNNRDAFFFLLCFGVAQALDLIRGFGYAGQGSHGKLAYDPLKFNICLPSNSTVTEYMKRLQICEGYTYLNVFIFIYYYQLFYYYYYYCYYYYQ